MMKQISLFRLGWIVFYVYWMLYTFFIVPQMGDVVYLLLCLFALFTIIGCGVPIFSEERSAPSYVAYSRKHAFVRGHTDKQWRELCAKYSRRCLCCGRPGTRHNPITRDHIVPIRWGGLDTIDNIQPLCKNCNSRKKDKTIDYRKEAIAP